MSVVTKKMGENVLKIVKTYFDTTPTAKVYPTPFYAMSSDTIKFLEDNGYKCRILDDGKTEVSKP